MKTEDKSPDASADQDKNNILYVLEWLVNDSPEMLYPWTTEEELQKVMDDFHNSVVNASAFIQSETPLVAESGSENTILELSGQTK